ncbi:uncharacterized protein LOC129294125 [Prosopis cineraria]|uniref:uncharacterized protein LOC129294125 n=1 Tax=Prosopis cineraria TaxID=364024 RepID=UPI0024104977|nr:uncharacterized protein LOC129294125 [Prosopis cineraria]
MVGGGNRRDEGSLMINNTNVFAALDALKKRKKSDKERKSKGSSKSQVQSKEPEPQVFWAPTPLNAKSWADVDDDDDDDYFATTGPPRSVWGGSEPEPSKGKPSYVEDSESEEDILDEGDDDVEEEHDHEPELFTKPEHEVKKPAEAPLAPKEAERQLSKKERKKKELAELEALLADFGVTQKESNGQDESRGAPQDKKDAEADGEKKENITVESKSAKKKKKKDKASKEVKESQDQPNTADTNNVGDEVTALENAEEDTSTVDVKGRLKKVASTKKKKSSKEMDAAARAAAQEAAARSARLVAAKKKEKNHYNQQPVR